MKNIFWTKTLCVVCVYCSIHSLLPKVACSVGVGVGGEPATAKSADKYSTTDLYPHRIYI